MKPGVIVLIILIMVVAYVLFDEYLSKENNPEVFQMEEKASASASTSKPISQPESIKNEPEEIKGAKLTLSPYYGKVKISGIQKETNYRPCLISLKTRIAEEEKINLKNWKIKTRKGQNSISEKVIIHGYMNIYLIGSSSPLGGKKVFRPDKCFGYLSKAREIYPSVYTYCSGPKLEDVSHLAPYCQEFILRSYGCQMPNYSADFKISTDRKCVSYIIDYFTYSGCVKRHSKDDNFLRSQWYVYLNQNFVQPLHDTVYLYDPNGLLVDKYIY